ncbi:MAG: hypothetical protein ACJAZ1_003460 [Yoonia sp.]|jgi:hypothetical protein
MVDQHKTGTRPNRVWRIVLVCSLALNLAVFGVVVGSFATGRLGDGPPRSFDLGLGPISRALAPQERREVGRSLRQDREMRDFDLRGRVSGMVGALKADPFEPEILRAYLSEQNAQMAAVQSKAQDALLATISQMTPERRAEFADQLLHELSKVRARQPNPSRG